MIITIKNGDSPNITNTKTRAYRTKFPPATAMAQLSQGN